MNFYVRLAVVLTLALSWLSASAASDNNAAAELRQRLDATTSLQGKFTQTLTDTDGTLLEESEGEFALQRPGRFYWKTAAPYEQLLVSNQEVIWLYDPDLEQVTVREFTEDLQQTPAVLLSGDLEQLQRDFAISRVAGEEAFLLVPNNQDGLFQTLILVFKAELLIEIRLQDSLGQESRFTLKDAVRNRPIDAALFNFTPPEGVDILID
jgi:outer membrane lipoprotein carrier protein